MKLLAKKLRRQLPPIADTGGFAGWVAHVKLFPPDSNWTWYAAQFDDDDLFLGLVDGWEMEMGCLSLSEVERVRRPSLEPEGVVTVGVPGPPPDQAVVAADLGVACEAVVVESAEQTLGL